ncbi:MAG: leucine-rich repeat domain-containing protein [Ruminococcaceae bacterium]|nr:leucine-rich repeat domain-containing protein [Oscillospiraceae bacterium]
MKRLFCLLLTLCLLLPCLLLTACGPDEEPGDNGEGSITEGTDTPTLSFTLLDDGTYSVSKGGLGYAREIVIPATHNDKPVTQIAAKGFLNAGFEKITIPASIQVIGAEAFSGCTYFKEIVLPEGLKEIGDSTFKSCIYLEAINIPASVTRIGHNAFMGCTSLTSVTVPEGVTEIGAQAFWGCLNIKSFSLPSTLKTVGYMAFAIIGDDTLDKPHDLEYYTLDGNKYLGNAQNPRLVLVELGDKSITQYAIPTDTRIIYSYAFHSSAITQVLIHADVTGISAYAFYYCEELTAVHIPDKVTVLGEGAFRGCRKLKKVTGMNFIEEIGDYAFLGCSSASNSFEISISSTLKAIGSSVFPSVAALKCTTDKDVTYLGNSTNPYLIAIRALNPSSTKSYTIHPDTKIIYENAFQYCIQITSILIPDGVFKLSSGAFRGCSDLDYVSLPNTLQTIEASAFRNCTRLQSIVIPDSVTYIGVGALYGCTGIATIKIPFVGTSPEGGNVLFGSIFGATTLDHHVTRVPKALHTVIVTGGKTIGSAAFSDCEYIESITLPASLEHIGEGAFFFTKRLSAVHISDVAAWCNVVMDTSTSSPFTYPGKLYLNGTRVRELQIPDGVTSINTFAFMNTLGIEKVVIPDSVTVLGDDCFKNCKDLTTVEFGKGVIEIKSSAFENCSKLTDLTLPQNLEILESSCLRGCSSLTEIVLPRSLRFIGDRAFKSCDALEKITFKGKFHWQVLLSRTDTKGEKLFLFMKEKNATYLVEDYANCYWVRTK